MDIRNGCGGGISVAVIKFMRILTRAVILICYMALAGIVVCFPFIYLGPVLVFPYWRWDPLLDHMEIQDSLPYFVLLALLASVMRIPVLYLSHKISEDG